MNLKVSQEYQTLQEAAQIVTELGLTGSAQAVALKYLLSSENQQFVPLKINKIHTAEQEVGDYSDTAGLRAFLNEKKPTGAVAEIPAMIFWAKAYDQKESVDEQGIVELYRRAGKRPPKNVLQSVRDLCSKKYNRLISVERGQFSLSRSGEDFVLHDLNSNQ